MEGRTMASDEKYAFSVEELRSEVRREYAEVATHPNKGFHFHTGRKLAKLLGYEDAWLDGIPEHAIESLAGTGNPFRMGEMKRGWRVVDIGCGAGMDSLIAARQVGPEGRVIGVDMTPQMLERARGAAAQAGAHNVQFVEGHAEALPVEDGWADIVISNGVINLCPDKPGVFREIRRVLGPSGRVQIADILVSRPVPEKAKRNIDLWTG
jgi:ubiquinone/menaquinone biosynthesis C-methylase UbiE